jgi:hypothetical protein
LIAADVLLTAVVVLGLALLVVPGILFFTWFAFVAPLIEIEERGVRDAFRRSRELVRGRFWIVLAAIGITTLASEAMLSGLRAVTHSALGEGVFVDWLGEALGDALTNPPYAVIVVLMAVEIMRGRGEAPGHG